MLRVVFFYIYIVCSSTPDITETKVRPAFAFQVFGSVLSKEKLKGKSCYEETSAYNLLTEASYS